VVHHSREDALGEAEFEALLDVASELEPPYAAEATWILIGGGRLGMRAGELCHAKRSWVNWERKQIKIPRHESCDCAYCRERAEVSARRLDRDPDEVFDEYWQPKTMDSARTIPFDFDDEVEALVTAFFDEYEQYEHSRASVNRRVDRLAEAAGVDSDTIYPHALRATAATYHAYRGLSAVPLQSLLGWAQMSTAQKYIRHSGGATARALRDAHSD
jgi:integrase